MFWGAFRAGRRPCRDKVFLQLWTGSVAELDSVVENHADK